MRRIAAAAIAVAALGAGTVGATTPPTAPPESTEPATTVPAAPVFLELVLPADYPPPQLCDAYRQLVQLVSPAGPDSFDIIDAYFIVTAEESATAANGRFTDEQREEMRAGLATCR